MAPDDVSLGINGRQWQWRQWRQADELVATDLKRLSGFSGAVVRQAVALCARFEAVYNPSRFRRVTTRHEREVVPIEADALSTLRVA